MSGVIGAARCWGSARPSRAYRENRAEEALLVTKSNRRAAIRLRLSAYLRHSFQDQGCEDYEGVDWKYKGARGAHDIDVRSTAGYEPTLTPAGESGGGRHRNLNNETNCDLTSLRNPK